MTTLPVLYLIATAAGSTHHIDDGIQAAQADGWDVHLVLTPTAARWWEPRMGELEEMTGHPVVWEYRVPGQEVRGASSLPKADAIVVAPITTTSACKWAAGITDTVALGIPAEAVHMGVPVAVMPFWNTALYAQPAVRQAVTALEEQGVRFVFGPGEPHPPKSGRDGRFPWQLVLDAVRA
ncbi:flavoprotein [Streptomyces sp. SPB074]|uniref:flavoprotein n=1 Tax=Streptomyces sp. (strain SPB074) TaxID=465543 RepID=UPI00017F1918|nr:flavoprotein [Streptomyces sp. SPB074]